MAILLLYILLILNYSVVNAQTSTETPTPTVIPSPTSAASNPNLSITYLPASVIKTEPFITKLSLNYGKNSIDYFVKCYGGANSENYAIEVSGSSGWINGFNGSWQGMPKVTTNDSGSFNLDITLKTRLNFENGDYKLTCKTVEALNYQNSVQIVSTPSYFSVQEISPTPTPTSTPSPTPTLNPTPTNSPTPTLSPTPTPTKTPTRTPTSTQIVSATPTPMPSITPSITSIYNSPTTKPTPYEINELASENVLGESTGSATSVDPTANPISDNRNNKVKILPMIFIIAGGILLIMPLVVKRFGKDDV